MSTPISSTTSARFGASTVALAPTVMLAGLFAHPYIATLPDEAAVAEAVAADTTYWGLVHLTAAVACPGARVSHHSELSPGGDYLNGIG